MINDDRTLEFWSWFSANSKALRSAYNDGDTDWLDAQISSRVKRVGPTLNWEIGPYAHPDCTFVLSPTIRENLPTTRTAVAHAPRLDGWRFLHAKPRKILNSLDFEANGHRINADNWLYRMTAYNGGEFVDIELFFPDDDHRPSGHEPLFCELVVESLIGEELRLDRVGFLQPHILAADTDACGLTQIQHLHDHLLSILDPTADAVSPPDGRDNS